MSCGKCGSSKCICPVSLGIAMAVTSALAVLIWVIWAIVQGVEDVTWSSGLLYVAMVFVKGFVFGFVLALIYDFIATRCKGRCCRGKDGSGCKCGCAGKCNCSGNCNCGGNPQKMA